MREDHQNLQTPKKEMLQISSNRKVKPNNAQSKKLHHNQQKSSKKSLNSVFTPISEDAAISISQEESIENISSISESVDADQSIGQNSKRILNSNFTPEDVALQSQEESVGIPPVSEAFVFEEEQSTESYIMSLNQFISPSSVTPGSLEMTPLSSTLPVEMSPISSISTAEMTPLSSTITTEKAEDFDSSVTFGAGTEESNSFTVEPVVKHLRQSMIQVLCSADIDPQYKKLLDALSKMVIEEFYSLHEERNLAVELFSSKAKVVFLSLVLCILAVSVGLILISDAQSSYHGPPPT